MYFLTRQYIYSIFLAFIPFPFSSLQMSIIAPTKRSLIPIQANRFRPNNGLCIDSNTKIDISPITFILP